MQSENRDVVVGHSDLALCLALTGRDYEHQVRLACVAVCYAFWILLQADWTWSLGIVQKDVCVLRVPFGKHCFPLCQPKWSPGAEAST